MKLWEQYWPYKQIAINDDEQKEVYKNIKESCIAFIDILGFKDMVSANVDKVVLALRYLKLFRDSFFRMPSPQVDIESSYSFSVTEGVEIDEDVDDYMDRPIATMFSDSIVISQEINDAFSFANFISLLAQMQFELLREGILIRGGIDIGEVYHDESFIFGEGMISAYLLESKVSKYPRITISEKALATINAHIKEQFENEFRKHIKFGNEKVMILPHNLERYYDFNEMEYVSFDELNIPFIDYLDLGFRMLKASPNNENLEIPLYILENFEMDTLSPIRCIIIDGMRNDDSRVQEKYKWLQTYYNKKISNILKSYQGKVIGADKAFMDKWETILYIP